jgi:hypothetical protein
MIILSKENLEWPGLNFQIVKGTNDIKGEVPPAVMKKLEHYQKIGVLQIGGGKGKFDPSTPVEPPVEPGAEAAGHHEHDFGEGVAPGSPPKSREVMGRLGGTPVLSHDAPHGHDAHDAPHETPTVPDKKPHK